MGDIFLQLGNITVNPDGSKTVGVFITTTKPDPNSHGPIWRRKYITETVETPWTIPAAYDSLLIRSMSYGNWGDTFYMFEQYNRTGYPPVEFRI